MVRETLYEVVRAVSAGQMPPDAALDRLSRIARNRRLVTSDGRLGWEWSDADRLLGPIVERAAELLVSVPMGKVRQCADAGCGWVFLDRSRSGRRRWCRMDDCGNRAKARRHYQRGRRAKLSTIDE